MGLPVDTAHAEDEHHGCCHHGYLKCLISFMVAPTEALFIASPPAFDGLHDDIKLFVVRRLYPKLLKKI